MDMYAAYREVGSYRAEADVCGTTPKRIKRSVTAAKRAQAGGGGSPGHVAQSYDGVAELVAASIERTKGRITVLFEQGLRLMAETAAGSARQTLASANGEEEFDGLIDLEDERP